MNDMTAIRHRAFACCGLISLAVLSACGGSGGGAKPDLYVPDTLTIQVAPVFTKQPQSHSVPAGHPVNFSVAASFSDGYQWTRNGVEEAGSTSPTYASITSSLRDSGDVIRAVIRAGTTTVISDPALLLIEGVGVRTLAGGAPESTLARVDGMGKEARFVGAGSMTQDSAGNFLVVETGRQAIRKVTPTGVVTTWINGLAADAGVRFPRHIAAGANGVVYVTDGDAERATALRKIGADGKVSTIELAGDPRNPLIDPIPMQTRYTALAADAAGNVYVASMATRLVADDACSSCMSHAVVRKIAPDGKVTLLLSTGRAPTSVTHLVRGLAADKAGNVYALDAEQLYKIDAAGVASIVMTNGLAHINVITTDTANNVYFAAQPLSGLPSTWPAGAIGKVTPQGLVSVLADPSKDERFAINFLGYMPLGIAVDAAGAVYLSEPDRISKRVLP